MGLLNSGRNGINNNGRGEFTENFNQRMEQRTTEQESLRVISKERETNTIAPMALPKMMEKGASHQGPMIKKASTLAANIADKGAEDDYYNDDYVNDDDDEENYTDPESPEKSSIEKRRKSASPAHVAH